MNVSDLAEFTELVNAQRKAANDVLAKRGVPEQLHPPVFEWPNKVDLDALPVPARVNQGRWIADCPMEDCAGAEYVDPDVPVFFCQSCGMGGGPALTVEFPADYSEIEKWLLRRPEEEHRNWRPGVTLKQLKHENRGT